MLTLSQLSPCTGSVDCVDPKSFQRRRREAGTLYPSQQDRVGYLGDEGWWYEPSFGCALDCHRVLLWMLKGANLR